MRETKNEKIQEKKEIAREDRICSFSPAALWLLFLSSSVEKTRQGEPQLV